MSLQARWNRQRQRQEDIRQAGGVLLRTIAGRIQVISPFDPRFQSWAHGHEGHWRPRGQFWSFPAHRRVDLRAELIRIYGPVIHEGAM